MIYPVCHSDCDDSKKPSARRAVAIEKLVKEYGYKPETAAHIAESYLGFTFLKAGLQASSQAAQMGSGVSSVGAVGVSVIKGAVAVAGGIKTARQREAWTYKKKHPLLGLGPDETEKKRACDPGFVYAVIRTLEARGKGEYGGDVPRAVANKSVTFEWLLANVLQ